MNKYTVEIFYSKEDEGYIAVIPELQWCSAFGKSEKEALKEVKIAMELWLETAEKEGREIPKTQGKNSLKKNSMKNSPSLHTLKEDVRIIEKASS